MKGTVTKRGHESWRLKFDVESQNGKRNTIYKTVRAKTKREAETLLAEEIGKASRGELVATSKSTVAMFLERWLEHVKPTVSAKTHERYDEIVNKHLVPSLGAQRLQKLTTQAIDAALSEMLTRGRRLRPAAEGERAPSPAGLAPRTVRHHAIVLKQALDQAVTWQLLARNPAGGCTLPQVPDEEIEILNDAQVGDVLTKLRDHALYPIVSLALGTGMRRGELLGLQWGDVDLAAGMVRVARSVEQTKNGLALKSPKTRSGRRTLRVATAVIDDLRERRRRLLELRLQLGAGKLPDEAPVFATIEGGLRSPNALTKEWTKVAVEKRLPAVTFHALRHTHASQLIAAGLDVVTVSKRLGHANPAITLKVYSHLFTNSDERAAEVVDAAFRRARPE
jgi:integrase